MPPKENHVMGQYAGDRWQGENVQDKHGVRVRGDGSPELHFTNLFDEDEDRAGERVDLATGEPIDNSTHTAEDDILAAGHIIEDTHLDRRKDPGNDLDPRDAAANWLAQAEKAVRAAQDEVDDSRAA